MHQRKSIKIRALFDTVVGQLQSELRSGGFTVCGTMALGTAEHDTGNNQVIVVDLPGISSKMIAKAASTTPVLPVLISVKETYMGGVEISVINPTQMIAAEENNDDILYLAMEVTNEIERISQKIERTDNVTPDVVTSWD